MKIKFTLFNFEYDNSSKANKKVNKKSSKTVILETFFVSLLVAVLIEIAKFLISCL